MVSLLNRKLWRDIGAMRGQVITTPPSTGTACSSGWNAVAMKTSGVSA